MKTLNKILVSIITGMILYFGAGYNLYAQQNDTSELLKQARSMGIEEQTLTELQNRAEQQKISDQQLQTIVKTALSMSEENLPADIAVKKALEGLSKGIPGERIGAVLGQLHQSVRTSAEVVDPWIKKPEVQQMIGRSDQSMSADQFRNELTKAASKSVMQNNSAESITGILSQIEEESVLARASSPDIVAAVGILADLPSTAKRPQDSGAFVVRALKSGFHANDLQKLPSAIEMAQQRSELPSASVIEGVSKQMRGGIPAKEILQNLFNGNVGGGPPGNIPKGLENKGDRGNSNGNN